MTTRDRTTAASPPRSNDPALWLAARVLGPAVLEVAGDGRVLAPRLAAAGHRVTVVSDDPAALDGLAGDSAVDVRNGRLEEVDLSPNSWDSVLLSEGLSRSLAPDALVARLAELARAGAGPDDDGARVLLSVALGRPAAGRGRSDLRWAFYVDDLLLLVAPHLAISELEILGDRMVVSARARRPDEGLTTLAEIRAQLGDERLAILLHDALEQRELAAAQRRSQSGPAPWATSGDAASLEQAYQELYDALRVTQKSLQKSEQKRSGHYRQLRKTRDALKDKTARLQEIYSSRRYRLATLVSETLLRPWRLLLFPFRLPGALRHRPVKDQVDWRDSGGAEPAGPARATEAGGDENEVRPSRLASPRGPVLAPSSSPVRRRELRVAAILDEMSTACFAPECDLVTFTPDNWREVLEERPPHLLLVESAWQGNGGSWQYKIGRYNHPDAGGLDELLDWFRERDLPTVFWNKEDPVHFAKFEDAARRFDHVLTTDANVVERYEALANSRIRSVAAMTFAAQPLLHNPVAAPERSSAPCFAGSYYANRHVARRAKMEMLLDGAREAGLVIYDRNYGSDKEDFQFPERFRPHIVGRLPYDRVIEAYKSHKVFLNVNSVEDSPTMLSRRVFELLACGTAVVSTPSVALATIFGDLVVTVETETQAREAIRHLIEDDDARRRLVERGRRFVLERHTYSERLAQVAEIAGLGEVPGDDRRVTALLPDASVESARRLMDGLKSQRLDLSDVVLGARDGDEAVRLERFAEDEESASSGSLVLRVVTQEDDAPEAVCRRLAALAPTPWVTFVDPHALGQLPPHSLGDLLLATAYTGADALGPPLAEAETGDEQVYGGPIAPAPSLVRRELVVREGWVLDPQVARSFEHRLEEKGWRLYRTDRPAGREDR